MAKDKKNLCKQLTNKRTNNATNINRPTRKVRPDPDNNIAKSKKLVEKLHKCRSGVNSSRSNNRSKDDTRVSSKVRRPVPSLADLERMYEDSDEDDQSKPVLSQTNNLSTNAYLKTPTENLTCKTTKTIANKMMDIISNHPDPTTTAVNGTPTPSQISPSKKRKSDCKGHQHDPNIVKNDMCSNKRVKISTQANLYKPSFTTNDNIAAWLKDREKAESSDDSSKTVDYDYAKSPPTNNVGKPTPFSPLPSTSKDKETINKNDQLFNESLIKETDVSKTNVDSKIPNMEVNATEIIIEKESEAPVNITDTSNIDDVEIIQTPHETIVIDDEIVTKGPITRKYSNKSDIIECIDIVEPVIKKERRIMTTCSETIVIDDEDGYEFIDDIPTQDDTIDVNDIDSMIAENKAIIQKHRIKEDLNTVTYVDTTTRSNLNTEPHNSSSKPGTTNKKQQDKSANIQNIVTNYFSNHSEKNQSGDIVPRKVTETNMSRNLIGMINSLLRSVRSNNKCTENGNVIVLDDTHIAFPSNSKRMRINGVEQSLNSCQNPQVDIDVGDSEYMNVFSSGEDVVITSCDTPPPHLDPTKMKHSRISLANFFKKQSTQPGPVASQSPVKNSPPRKNLGDCPICMDSLSNNSVASTICGHVFCMKCIEAAFRASGKRCPTCRKVLKKGGYHQIFL